MSVDKYVPGNPPEFSSDELRNLIRFLMEELVRIENSHGATFETSVVIGTAALATTAVKGFLYLPTCAGAPTGTPESNTGTVPMVVDTTNLRIYINISGTWRYAALT